MDELSKSCDNNSRENGLGVIQPKWHNGILVTAIFYRKGCFMSIFFRNPYLMVALKPICE